MVQTSNSLIKPVFRWKSRRQQLRPAKLSAVHQAAAEESKAAASAPSRDPAPRRDSTQGGGKRGGRGGGFSSVCFFLPRSVERSLCLSFYLGAHPFLCFSYLIEPLIEGPPRQRQRVDQRLVQASKARVQGRP
jgi:hypothetical protein